MILRKLNCHTISTIHKNYITAFSSRYFFVCYDFWQKRWHPARSAVATRCFHGFLWCVNVLAGNWNIPIWKRKKWTIKWECWLVNPKVGTLGSRIEVPVCLFFFGVFSQPVCLIWVYVFNRFFEKWIACLLIWEMYAY